MDRKRVIIFYQNAPLKHCMSVKFSSLRKQIIDCCANSRMSASAGNRYRCMLWTRDLAYMAPAYFNRSDQSIQFKQALQTIVSFQQKEHTIVNNGYERINQF